MPRSEKSSTTMLPTTGHLGSDITNAQTETAFGRLPEQLVLELDFARTSRSHDTEKTHPHVLFSPVHYEPGYAYPLLVWLHGSGGDEREVMRIMPSVSMRNYVAVAPRGQEVDNGEMTAGNTARKFDISSPNLDISSILRDRCRTKTVYDWPDTDECLLETEQRVFDCISVAVKRCNIASNRVFIAGYGTGGTMALRLAFLYPEHFAGVASLNGAFSQRSQILPRWMASRSRNVFLGVGQDSTVFSPETACRSLELLHTAGFPVTVREYSCGQELVPAMLQDLNRWMMAIVCDR